MDYLTDDLETRLDPARILEGTKSFIVVADLYSSRWGGHASAGSAGGSILSTESTERRKGAPREDGKEQTDTVPLAQSRTLSSRSALSVLKDDSQTPPASFNGRIARYAQGKNYHDVMKRRLHRLADQLRIDYPGSEFRTCVDTAPVNERELASLAGLGWQAKNTLILNPKLGSYMLLGVVATTLDLAATASSRDQSLSHRPAFAVPDSCGTCTRCIDACPTRAITPYSVDARRCVSYLTIEHRGVIDPQFHAGMGRWLFGCDVCQEVCPHNSPRSSSAGAAMGIEAPIHVAYAARHTSFDLLEVLNWTEQQRRGAFTNSPMKRATLAMMKRNALIALGNVIRENEVRTENAEVCTVTHSATSDGRARVATTAPLRTRIAQAASDLSEPELVRRTAAAVLRWLDQGRAEMRR